MTTSCSAVVSSEDGLERAEDCRPRVIGLASEHEESDQEHCTDIEAQVRKQGLRTHYSPNSQSVSRVRLTSLRCWVTSPGSASSLLQVTRSTGSVSRSPSTHSKAPRSLSQSHRKTQNFWCEKKETESIKLIVKPQSKFKLLKDLSVSEYFKLKPLVPLSVEKVP